MTRVLLLPNGDTLMCSLDHVNRCVWVNAGDFLNILGIAPSDDYITKKYEEYEEWSRGVDLPFPFGSKDDYIRPNSVDHRLALWILDKLSAHNTKAMLLKEIFNREIVIGGLWSFLEINHPMQVVASSSPYPAIDGSSSNGVQGVRNRNSRGELVAAQEQKEQEEQEFERLAREMGWNMDSINNERVRPWIKLFVENCSRFRQVRV